MSHARPMLIGVLFENMSCPFSIRIYLWALQDYRRFRSYQLTPPLLLLTPRCLILSFFLVAAPSMTSSPSPSPVRGRLLHFPALPSANENMGYSITCLIFSPCCHSICLALKVICLQHHPSPVCFSLHKHELVCKRNERLEDNVLKFQGKIMTARLSLSSC